MTKELVYLKPMANIISLTYLIATARVKKIAKFPCLPKITIILSLIKMVTRTSMKQGNHQAIKKIIDSCMLIEWNG